MIRTIPKIGLLVKHQVSAVEQTHACHCQSGQERISQVASKFHEPSPYKSLIDPDPHLLKRHLLGEEILTGQKC